MVRAHLFISGIVQGVGYRYRCHREAASRDLVGWVRNLPDGRVEALFQGPRETVDGMIQWCYRGPSEARVSDIEVRFEESGEGLQGFRIR